MTEGAVDIMTSVLVKLGCISRRGHGQETGPGIFRILRYVDLILDRTL
jgi:hypothetical protein